MERKRFARQNATILDGRKILQVVQRHYIRSVCHPTHHIYANNIKRSGLPIDGSDDAGRPAVWNSGGRGTWPGPLSLSSRDTNHQTPMLKLIKVRDY
jgi:hypothetical protein